MRIKFFENKNKILTPAMKNFLYSGFEVGQIISLPESKAQIFIHEKLAEKFDYSISDDEIRQLYRDFTQTSDFKTKVEIYINTLSKEVNKAILEDGNLVEFKMTPDKPEEWIQYHLLLIQYYKGEFPDFDLEGLKELFNKKRFNSPDPSRLIGLELSRIRKTVQEDNPKGIEFWYNETINGNIPKDDEGYKSFLCNPIQFGVNMFLRGKALAEYEAHLIVLEKNKLNNKKQSSNPITNFSQLFISTSEYNKIMAILVRRKLCQKNTFIWIDCKKGTLSMLASLIKHLHSKGYYHTKPTNDEVKSIAKNTFKIDMGIDTVKRANLDDFDFSFIPESNSC